MDTKYSKQRSRILDAYIKFCKNGDVNWINLVFSNENLLKFINEVRIVNPKIAITHLSQILSALNMTNDVRYNPEPITLRNRPEFGQLIVKQKRPMGFEYFNQNDIDKLVKLHSAGSPFACRALFQLSTGIRCSNTMLNNNDHKIQWSAHKHSPMERCPPPNDSEGCCHTLIAKTKTGTKKILISPEVYTCCKHLEVVQSGCVSTLTRRYNEWLQLNFGKSSHTLRKALCNLTNISRNTGFWQNTNTMRFYVSMYARQFELAVYINSKIDGRSHYPHCGRFAC